ncbi:small fragment nuclease precursor [Danio rerio]|uniref:Oligoribonuclease, mitochondrial n=1 Tax=Danio rerio TaxID=7955 RepID=F1QNX9_DANRE|nr:small fragment nuclease precursor [Danio rerio]|eukprot:NP_957038.2 oligoribonuclease, mitochondrial precursor [Danio rerio]
MWRAVPCVSAFRALTRVCVFSQRVKLCSPVFPAHNFSHFSARSSVPSKGLMSRRRAPSRKMSQIQAQRMVWVDLEMTGLDIEKDQIIEMACIVTDSDLNVIAEGPNLIINQPDDLLDGMSDWCKEHHGKSGLTQAVRDSHITLQQAEYEFLSFIRQHTPPGVCPLAGNSVHADKKFLDKYMPQFMHHLHYRIIDVSTIKELSRRWYPEEYNLAPQKKSSHRALDDIQESIKELQFYRTSVFKAKEKKKIVENGNKTSTS